MRGKWIERYGRSAHLGKQPSSLVRGKWIERKKRNDGISKTGSSLVRGKWIESGVSVTGMKDGGVIPREREVD